MGHVTTTVTILRLGSFRHAAYRHRTGPGGRNACLSGCEVTSKKAPSSTVSRPHHCDQEHQTSLRSVNQFHPYSDRPLQSICLSICGSSLPQGLEFMDYQAPWISVEWVLWWSMWHSISLAGTVAMAARQSTEAAGLTGDREASSEQKGGAL